MAWPQTSAAGQSGSFVRSSHVDEPTAKVGRPLLVLLSIAL